MDKKLLLKKLKKEQERLKEYYEAVKEDRFKTYIDGKLDALMEVIYLVENGDWPE